MEAFWVTAYVYADISAFLIKIFVPYRIYWDYSKTKWWH